MTNSAIEDRPANRDSDAVQGPDHHGGAGVRADAWIPVARSVFGLKVVSDEPTKSRMRDRAGQTVVWNQTRTLGLVDGSVSYGCAHCDYVSWNMNSIRPHLRRHVTRSPAERRSSAERKAVTQTGDQLTLNELVVRLRKLDQIEASRNEWKTRAQNAERALRELKKLLALSS